MENHASLEQVRSFLRGTLPGKDVRNLVAHLVADCSTCRQHLHTPYTPEDYDAAFAAVDFEQLRQSIVMLNLRGIADWSYLEPLAQGRRLMLINNKERFQHLGLYNRLLNLTREPAWENPQHCVELAHLTVAVAHRLSESDYPRRSIADFIAAAHAALANAYRIDAQYAAAQRELDEAWGYLEEGTGDPLEEYKLLSIGASLEINLGRYESADRLLRKAIRKARWVDDPVAEAKALIQRGDAVGHQDPAKAIPLLKRALTLLGPNDEWCRLCARHNLAWFLNDLGRPFESIQMLDATRALYARFPHTVPSLVLHWLEGRIVYQLGDLATSEQILRKVWKDFYQAGFGHHLPILSIDLAEVLAESGKTGEAVRLLTETYTVMCAWRMDVPALAAIVAIRDTVARGAVEVAVFAEARLTFRRGFAVVEAEPEL